MKQETWSFQPISVNCMKAFNSLKQEDILYGLWFQTYDKFWNRPLWLVGKSLCWVYLIAASMLQSTNLKSRSFPFSSEVMLAVMHRTVKNNCLWNSHDLEITVFWPHKKNFRHASVLTYFPLFATEPLDLKRDTHILVCNLKDTLSL